MITRFDLTPDDEVRFWSKVAEPNEDGCKIWRGPFARQPYANKGWYGLFKLRRKMRIAHRVAYFLERGEIPEGKVLDHLCRVRACCNAEHLDPVTQAENMARGQWATLTQCMQGHEYTSENTYMHNGSRHCRTCQAARRQAWKNRQLIKTGGQ